MLHKITYTRGVQSVVTYGSVPAIVDDQAIALIKSKVGNDGYISFDDIFEPGDEVIIRDGSLQGLKGIFDRRLKDSERVLILLTNVNYQARITIDSQLVAKGGAPALLRVA